MTSGRGNAFPLTYRGAGVDVDAGNALVEAIRPLVRATQRPGADGTIGGFGGLFDLKACGFRDPVLVAATDGVGTKLRLAIESGLHSTIGIDLVAMCVNDLVAQGAEPLFFLDYFATGRLEVSQAAAVVAGIADGCQQAGCALIGGETAEMPGLYKAGDYDIAGFAVGAVERHAVLPRPDIAAGDALIGIASDGVHSNGYSLVRRIVERSGLALGALAPFDGSQTLAEALLTPTRIYVRGALAAAAVGVKAFAHITGGGLIENPPRAYPDTLAAEIDAAAWRIPPVFRWLADTGEVAPEEMARTFNCGIGMVAVAADRAADDVVRVLESQGLRAFRIGRLVPRTAGAPSVALAGWSAAWRG